MARPRRLTVRPGGREGQLALLGARQLLFLLVALGLVFVTAGVIAYPAIYRQYIQDVGIKEFERAYGFRTGLVSWQEPGQARELIWGIVTVIPDGAFARAGVRNGDIPLASHDRVIELYSTLEEAKAGHVVSFEVLNAADTNLGHAARRQIRLVPAQGRE